MKTNGNSVIIIFSGRLNHLKNTLRGLELGSRLPDEVILVEMGLRKSRVPKKLLTLKHHLLTIPEKGNLPIAAARNRGAELANYDTLIFLDVDCIPHADFINNIDNCVSKNSNGIYMGLPMYLNKEVIEVDSFDFRKFAMHHPERPNPKNILLYEDYGLFWSLCFFINSNVFFEIGGFDEHYSGYGAEDTDLSFKCKQKNINFYLTPFIVYHQMHNFFRPPINSLNSIICNCNYFYKKWGVWPMANHLKSFDELGYIDWKVTHEHPIELLSTPSLSAIEGAFVQNEPFS